MTGRAEPLPRHAPGSSETPLARANRKDSEPDTEPVRVVLRRRLTNRAAMMDMSSSFSMGLGSPRLIGSQSRKQGLIASGGAGWSGDGEHDLPLGPAGTNLGPEQHQASQLGQ